MNKKGEKSTMSVPDLQELADKIKRWGHDLGFSHVGITDIDLNEAGKQLKVWIEKGYHGQMSWMADHGEMRMRPELLFPSTVRVISVSLPYLPPNSDITGALTDNQRAYISRYALGRDYHKVLRRLLKRLCDKIKQHCEDLNYRAVVDSAPILERPLAQKAGIGWQGKHTLILNSSGSWFFLGELLVSIPLPIDKPMEDACGKCQACLQICPTGAIVSPYVLDARRCISYLTIEFDGIIPEALRPLFGNRIYGCDDCQLICPWNRSARTSDLDDFLPRHHLDKATLLALYEWDENTFLDRMQGSPIRRIGYEKWVRNITIALGNASYDKRIIHALNAKRPASTMLEAHISWAMSRQLAQQTSPFTPTPTQKRLLRQIALRQA